MILVYGLVGVLLATLLKLFVAQVFWVPSQSMENTLHINDRLLVERYSRIFSPTYEVGDIIVFEDPAHWVDEEVEEDSLLSRFGSWLGLKSDKRFLVKRVLAGPGDTLECCGADGRLRLNGETLDEPYLKEAVAGEVPFQVTVPADHYWVMGDNRNESGDSRFHMDDESRGFVAQELIQGKVVAIVTPFKHFTLNPAGEQ